MEKISLILLGTVLIAVSISLAVAVPTNTLTQNVTAHILQDYIDIFSPVEDGLYTNRMVLLNISTGDDKVLYLSYFEKNGRQVYLCKKCSSFIGKKPFDEGLNQLFVQGAYNQGIIYGNVDFTVDSKKPIIKKTWGNKGFSDGIFWIEFQEVNPKDLIFTYGNNITGFRNMNLDINSCTDSNKNKICNVNVSLKDYDQQKGWYWFSLFDISDKSAFSKTKAFEVDMTPPIINSVNYTIKRNYVEFKINITEKNFDLVGYYETPSKKKSITVLCRKLKNGICDIKKSFKNGNHTLIIEARDKAGLRANTTINFETIR